MRNESGVALVMVMGLLVVLSLIGVGLISQTVINTKFYEALGTSYQAVPAAQSDFVTKANVGIGNLIVGLGKRPSDGTLVTVLYGRKVGEVWQPDLSKPFEDIAQNYNSVSQQAWTVDQTKREITSTFSNTSKKHQDEERYFLFKDDSGVLECWTSYDLYLEFAVPSPPNSQSTSIVPMSWGVYYNSKPLNDIMAYHFQVSLKDDEFSVAKVANNTPTKAGLLKVPITGSISPHIWHSVEISVRSGTSSNSDLITARVDGVKVLEGPLGPPTLDPDLIGLSHRSERNEPTSSVTFRNISVTNATP